MNHQLEIESDNGSTMQMVKVKSERAMNEAFAVLDMIKEETISLAMASEASNAIGKANAAIGNIIKAELLSFAMIKNSSKNLIDLTPKAE